MNPLGTVTTFTQYSMAQPPGPIFSKPGTVMRFDPLSVIALLSAPSFTSGAVPSVTPTVAVPVRLLPLESVMLVVEPSSFQ